MRPAHLAAVLVALLAPGLAAGASNPLRWRTCDARGARFDVYDVEKQLHLVDFGLLEYLPREQAGPAVDDFTGDVIVGTSDGIVRALTARGNELWRTTLPEAITSTPVLTDESVFVGAADGSLHALDRFSGVPRWSRSVAAEVLERPVPAGSVVFVGTDHDTVQALDAGTGEVRWTYRRTTPADLTIRGGVGVALAGERLVAGFSDGTVVALGAADGRLIWENRLASALRKFPDSDAVPQVLGELVFVTSFSEGVFALDLATGRTRWRAAVPGAYGLALADDAVLVGAAGSARAFRPSNGAEIWTIATGEVALRTPVVTGSVAIFPSARGLLFADKTTGRPLRVFWPGSGFTSQPAPRARNVWALSDNGFLYELRLSDWAAR